MRKTITTTVGGLQRTSRPFDMECYRTMYDAVCHGLDDLAALAGLCNLTGCTEEELISIEAADLSKALDAIKSWYRAVRVAPGQQAERIGGAEGHPIRMLYQSLLKHHGLLPGDIDRQDPEFLYLVLTEDHQAAVPVDKIPASLRVMYGV